MATKATPPPEAEPQAAEATRAYWVHSKTAVGAGGAVGFVELPLSVGNAAVTAGTAQDPLKEDGMSLRYLEGDEPGGYPYVDPTPPPVTVAITAISAENPAKATISTGDMAKLTGKTKVTISGAGGAGASLVNKQFTIGAKTSTTFVLTGLDNTAPLVITGYPLTGTLAA